MKSLKFYLVNEAATKNYMTFAEDRNHCDVKVIEDALRWMVLELNWKRNPIAIVIINNKKACLTYTKKASGKTDYSTPCVYLHLGSVEEINSNFTKFNFEEYERKGWDEMYKDIANKIKEQ